jgi:tetratricopeptide (TPR) repeat protein
MRAEFVYQMTNGHYGSGFVFGAYSADPGDHGSVTDGLGFHGQSNVLFGVKREVKGTTPEEIAISTGDVTPDVDGYALDSRRARIEADGNAYGAKAVAILASEVEALALLARGRHDAAIQAATHAAEIELTMAAPSGPPDPIKPALELQGEVLFAAGRAAEAVAAFEQSLLRTPRRTPSLLGLARAAAAAGDSPKAHQAYSELASTKGAAATSTALREARDFLAGRVR